MNRKAKGNLIIIGGHENKLGDKAILEEVAKEAKKREGPVVVLTVASKAPEKLAKEYTKVFHGLGIKKVEVLDIRERAEAEDNKNLQKIHQASMIFFTGGDQLRISSQVGDSQVFQDLNDALSNGTPISGTSAGAAAMPETMIVEGKAEDSAAISAVSMAPGLGFISGVVIDSHFSERGRITRLLGAVVTNPKNLGLGIDEDTAIVVEGDENFRVIGSGAVYVVDGTDISFSSLSEEHSEGVISIFDLKLHVLRSGDRFDLVKRQPIQPKVNHTKEQS